MSKFHVNPETGQAGKCSASSGRCPFGGESGEANHFSSMAEAAMASLEAELSGPQFQVEVAATTDEHPCDLCGSDVGNQWDGWCDSCAKREFSLYLTAGKYR